MIGTPNLALVGPDAPWITVAGAVGLIVVTVWFSTIGPPARLHSITGLPMPELRWRYSVDDLRTYLLLDQVRSLYRSQLRWDFAFVALYGAGALLLVDGSLGRVLGDRSVAVQLLVLVPVLLLMAVDAVEDALLLAITSEGDRVGLVPLASVATLVKRVLTIALALEILLGLGLLALVGPKG